MSNCVCLSTGSSSCPMLLSSKEGLLVGVDPTKGPTMLLVCVSEEERDDKTFSSTEDGRSV